MEEGGSPAGLASSAGNRGRARSLRLGTQWARVRDRSDFLPDALSHPLRAPHYQIVPWLSNAVSRTLA